MSHPCSFCGGPFHPATGCAYGPRVVACAGCTRSFWAWVRRHTAARKGRADFYGAAGLHREEVRAAEARRIASRLDATWGHLSGYRGTIADVQRLARLVLAS